MLLKNCAFIITQDKRRNILKNFDILIEGGKIKKIAKNIDQSEGCEKVDCRGKIVMPSFVNCHTHIPMSLLRGYKDDLELHKWLAEVWRVEAIMTDRDYYAGARFALLEMIRSGTSAYMDMYFGTDCTTRATKEAGIRGYLGLALMDFEDPEKKAKLITDAKNSLKKIAGVDSPLIKPVISPHSIYTVSNESLIRAKELANDHNCLFTIHLSETRKEVYDCLKKYGKRPVEFLDSLGIIDKNFVGFHCGWVTKGEISILGRREASVVHCPVSNMKLATGAAFPYREMREAQVGIGLGTDGSCSNNSLNMLGEMKSAALLQKWFRWNACEMTAQEALDMATLNGAKILGLNSGSLEEGKNADILLMDKTHYSLLPSQNLVSNIVYSASREAITDLIVSGEFVMQERKVLTIDEEKTKEEFENISERLTKP